MQHLLKIYVAAVILIGSTLVMLFADVEDEFSKIATAGMAFLGLLIPLLITRWIAGYMRKKMRDLLLFALISVYSAWLGWHVVVALNVEIRWMSDGFVPLELCIAFIKSARIWIVIWAAMLLHRLWIHKKPAEQDVPPNA